MAINKATTIDDIKASDPTADNMTPVSFGNPDEKTVTTTLSAGTKVTAEKHVIDTLRTK